MRLLYLIHIFLSFITFSCLSYAHGIVHEQIDKLSNEITSQETDQNRIERARLYHLDGQLALASQDFKRARELNPENRSIDFLEATMWHDARRFDLALPLVNSFLKLRSNHINGLWLRARVQYALGHSALAISDYRQIASSTENMLPEMYLGWARSQAALTPTNLSAVNQIIQHGVEQLGSVASLLQFVIYFNHDHHEYQTALSWLNMLPEQLGKQPHWLVQQADLLELSGQHQKAKAKRQQALGKLLARQSSGTLNPAQHQLLYSLIQKD